MRPLTAVCFELALNGGLVSTRSRCQQDEGDDCPCVLVTDEAVSQLLCSLLGSYLQERHPHPTMCPGKGNRAVKGLEHKSHAQG